MKRIQPPIIRISTHLGYYDLDAVRAAGQCDLPAADAEKLSQHKGVVKLALPIGPGQRRLVKATLATDGVNIIAVLL